MIVLFVLGIVLLAYAAIKGVTRHEVRWPALVVGLILTVLMGLGLQRAQERHFLMAKVPVEKTQKIAPALTINGIKLITTQKASDGELRYTYTLGKKSYQTVTQNAKTIVKTADKQATLKTEVMTYQATSGWRRFMLLGQETFEKGAATYTLSVPKDWYFVTTRQAKTLQNMVKDSKAGIAKEVAAEVKQQFADKAKADKNFIKNKDAQNKLQAQIVTDVTNKANQALDQAMLEKIQSWHN